MKNCFVLNTYFNNKNGGLNDYATKIERQHNDSKIQSNNNNTRRARAFIKIIGSVRRYRQSLTTLPILYMYVLNYNKIKQSPKIK